MQAIAPNLTVLVGELVGARLIAHAGMLPYFSPQIRNLRFFLSLQFVLKSLAYLFCCLNLIFTFLGSLLNLAKQPSSTVQILGAEKALFR